MKETLPVVQELAWEVRRLTGHDSNVPGFAEDILDFGDTPWIGYHAKPWGLIAAQFKSEYLHVHGEPVLTRNEKASTLANIIVESRYRSIRSTGDLLCDRTSYEIDSDWSIEAAISVGELALAEAVHSFPLDYEDEPENLIHRIFGFAEPNMLTPEQADNNQRLEELSDMNEALPLDDNLRALINEEVKKLEDSGEAEFQMELSPSYEDMVDLVNRLKFLEDRDKLGAVYVTSIVDHHIS
jgi:hypothetical protein